MVFPKSLKSNNSGSESRDLDPLLRLCLELVVACSLREVHRKRPCQGPVFSDTHLDNLSVPIESIGQKSNLLVKYSFAQMGIIGLQEKPCNTDHEHRNTEKGDP